MRELILYLCMLSCIFTINIGWAKRDMGIDQTSQVVDKQDKVIAPMEALDAVREKYAANFEKVYTASTKDEYYYKLPEASYYLVYEGGSGVEKDYLIHLYEVVIDEPDTGIGHTVTYGWYTVDKEKGVITEQTAGLQ